MEYFYNNKIDYLFRHRYSSLGFDTILVYKVVSCVIMYVCNLKNIRTSEDKSLIT